MKKNEEIKSQCDLTFSSKFETKKNIWLFMLCFSNQHFDEEYEDHTSIRWKCTTNMHCSFRLLIVLLQMFFLNHTYPFCYRHNFFFLHLFFLHNTNTLAYCVFLIRADDTWTHEHAVHMENLHAKWKRKWKPELAPKNRKDRLVQKCKNKITTKQNKS